MGAWIVRGALVLTGVLGVLACESAKGIPGVVFRDAPMPVTDAGADAASPVGRAPPLPGPPREPTPPPRCFDVTACTPREGGYAQIYEAPEGLELRHAQDTTLLAYDANARQLVALAVVPTGDSGLPTVAESERYDSKFTRVLLAGGLRVRWSADGADVRDIRGWSQLPKELEATTAAGFCVAGRGLWCESVKGWGWRLRPEQVTAPFAHVAELREPGSPADELLLVDTEGRSFLLHDGEDGSLETFDLGTRERIATLGSGHHARTAEWAAVTTSGRLVRGSLVGATACPAATGITFATVSYRTSLSLQVGDGIVVPTLDGCVRTQTPPGIRGHGVATCGIAASTFVFDERRVYAQPVTCVYD